jgi:FixJ family two-component response regulator
MTAEKPYTILCVDDEKDILDTLFDTFIDTYQVKTALTGEDALKILALEDVFAVISDQRMPAMTGTELLAKVNQIKPNCKKILLTGYADINASIDAINKGNVDRYFSKPWDDEEIILAVNSLLSLYKADVFLEKMVKDSEIIKKKTDRTIYLHNLLLKFVGSYPAGICIINEKGQIEYLNNEGLEILSCSDIEKIKGQPYKERFQIDESTGSEIEKRQSTADIVFNKATATGFDNLIKPLNLSMAFIDDSGACLPTGFIFKAI